MKVKVLNILKMVLGFIVMFGCFLPIYIIDRLMCVPLVWLKAESLVSWFRNNDMILQSSIRVGVFGIIGFIVWLFI